MRKNGDVEMAAATAAALHVTVDTDMAEVMARDLDGIQAAIDKISRRWAKLFGDGKAEGGAELFQAASEALAVAQVSVRAPGKIYASGADQSARTPRWISGTAFAYQTAHSWAAT